MHDLHTQTVQGIELLLQLGVDAIEILLRALELHGSADSVECLRRCLKRALEALPFELERGPVRLHEEHAGVELSYTLLRLCEQGKDALPTDNFRRRGRCRALRCRGRRTRPAPGDGLARSSVGVKSRDRGGGVAEHSGSQLSAH